MGRWRVAAGERDFAVECRADGGPGVDEVGEVFGGVPFLPEGVGDMDGAGVDVKEVGGCGRLGHG